MISPFDIDKALANVSTDIDNESLGVSVTLALYMSTSFTTSNSDSYLSPISDQPPCSLIINASSLLHHNNGHIILTVL